MGSLDVNEVNNRKNKMGSLRVEVDHIFYDEMNLTVQIGGE